jgi:flagellar basal body-associated protein FliL
MSEHPASAPEAPAAAPKGRGLLSKLIILIFLVVVVVTEVVVALLYLPSASADASHAKPPAAVEGQGDAHGDEAAHDEAEADAHGGDGAAEDDHGADAHGADAEHAAEEHGAEAGHGGHGAHGEAEEEPPLTPANAGSQQEVDLGEFAVQAYQLDSNTTRVIDFHLYGTVRRGEKSEFDRKLAASKNRIREQIIVTLRSADRADLTDPGLGLIKRQILAKTNATLGKAYLQEIVFSNFSFMEQ